MEPEHRLLLRRTYARNLAAFVKRLGILSVRHLKRLERVIIGYLEVYDGPEEEARLKMLETLKLLLQYTWPRLHLFTYCLSLLNSKLQEDGRSPWYTENSRFTQNLVLSFAV
ncbi:TELO2-interacting protein 2-like isoform 1-T1 [Dama dama]|uniref:TELO2-interacting protein 2-like n=1 Tax=Dama dama TaxID=30532 RepID=UPI002A364BA5|nr:TELO2-interacting protein 2-like [Dama dama]